MTMQNMLSDKKSEYMKKTFVLKKSVEVAGL